VLPEAAPRVTIGILSFNRLLYLRALIESARACIQYPNVEWIVVDGGSTEAGLQEYLHSLDFLDELLVLEGSTHADALNALVERATGACTMILPEDVQFIVRGTWMHDLVELVGTHPRVGHVTFDVQRQATVDRQFGAAELAFGGRLVKLPVRRRYRRYTTTSGQSFLGYGSTRPGIGGPGIMSFCRAEIWQQLGPWRTVDGVHEPNDSSLGAEDEMLARYAASDLEYEAVMMRYPVAADIITDPRGTKAKIRGGTRRYGRYAPPPDGRLYYRIWDADELADRFGATVPAPGFESYVVPVGFDLPLDATGGLLKASVIDDAEPFELVAPGPPD
jgi:glycosyltransferase involved in cell wall biosynthesis